MKRKISSWTLLGMEKKSMEHESDVDTNCNWCSWYSHQRIGTKTGGLENKMTRGDHPNDGIIDISQNTEKSPEDLRRLAVTQTPVRTHRLTLVGKVHKGVNNDNSNNNYNHQKKKENL